MLERSFALDKFDQTTYNLLTMLDSLDKFEVVSEGNLVIKLDASEMPVMREFVGPLAQQALATFAKKYQFTPKGPILIEMFPKHDDFAVRTVGLPGMIGALGACFGRVVTLDSPKARPPGDFNWEPTLWHELAHVIHAAAVEAARAAVAHRRHFDLRRETRIARLGTRRGAHVCRRLRRRAST